MFEKIINTFFEKKKKINCITVIKNRESKLNELMRKRKEVVSYNTETTCLTKYFTNRKGLNMKVREEFYINIFKAQNQR